VAAASAIAAVHAKGVVSDNCTADGGCSQTGLDAAHAGKTWVAVNTVSLVTAAAAGALGVGLLVWSSRASKTSLVPTAGPAFTGLSLSRSFP
jgi:hypothetical protein